MICATYCHLLTNIHNLPSPVNIKLAKSGENLKATEVGDLCASFEMDGKINVIKLGSILIVPGLQLTSYQSDDWIPMDARAFSCSLSDWSGRTSSSCFKCGSVLKEPYIRCAECNQVNICITCFAKGAEGFPHKNNHSYIVIRNNFPLFADSTWKAYEEIRFLDALLECGFGNWGDIARQLKTRNKEECEKHFSSTYIDNPELPSFSESLQPLIKLTPLPYWEYRPIDIEDPPRYTAISGQCYQALGGYNAARGDFDVEYDNYAEAAISQMELDIYKNEDEDCKLIQSLQVAIFNSYNQRLKDRKRRKQIIRDHGLILIRKTLSWLQRYENTITKSVCDRVLIFMQLMSGLDFEYLMEGLHHAGELRQYILRLQDLRENGLTCFHSCRLYQKLKRDRENQQKERRMYMSNPAYCWRSIKEALLKNHSMPLNNKLFQATTVSTYRRIAPPLDIIGLPGYDRLTPAERQMCSLVRLVPESYLDFKWILTTECKRHNGLKLAQARTLIKIDVNKTRKVFDFLLQEGYIYLPS
uniref:Transcriptional adapter n=1 Tax=Timema poppense TaxID=170557 RepID=A0A7R9CNI5_TIMPO|nr:unnamed protein product [Timema poppensis]